jgi:hypothetical protein
MKETIEFALGDKKYEIGYSIKQLRTFEHMLGHSLIAVFDKPNKIVEEMNIDFTTAGITAGCANVTGEKTQEFKTTDEVYDFMDEYCAAGGTLGELNDYIMTAVIKTGLFIPGQKTTARMKENE